MQVHEAHISLKNNAPCACTSVVHAVWSKEGSATQNSGRTIHNALDKGVFVYIPLQSEHWTSFRTLSAFCRTWLTLLHLRYTQITSCTWVYTTAGTLPGLLRLAQLAVMLLLCVYTTHTYTHVQADALSAAGVRSLETKSAQQAGQWLYTNKNNTEHTLTRRKFNCVVF